MERIDTSLRSSRRKKEYAVIGVIGVLLVGGVAGSWLNRDPYICSKKQREQVVSAFDPIIANWNDANDLASSTSRINLAAPVSNLQNIQKEAREQEVPQCAQPVKDHFLDMSQETINSYLLFMRDEPDFVVQTSIRSVQSNQRFFTKYYSRLKEGQ